MTARPLAHIMDFGDAASPVSMLGVLLATLLVVALVVEHTYVKHGRLGFTQLLKPLAVVLVVALGAVVAPLPSSAQPENVPGSGLPDLISDPPFIWSNRDALTPTGELIRVMTFDGYLHNIGTGPLDVRGNPQIPGDVKQRVFNGSEWEVVATPPVRFENDDGHNHFHFMDASVYRMWNEARTEIVGDASKVGFCLIDTEQLDDRYDASYLLEDNAYCEADNPGATELFMGITPGWRDTYGANVTFQWIDISNTTPGRYWVSAQVDPLNHIVESNEDNNDVVFSRNKYEVDGYVARTLDVQTTTEPITLKADSFGIVGRRAFVIDQAPSHGSLDVPTGVDVLGDEISYTPDPEFTGTDSFTYYAHDVTSPYPYDPVKVEVSIEVTEPGPAQVPSPTSPTDVSLEVSGVDELEGLKTFEPVSFVVSSSSAEEPRFFATNLPSGLSITEEGRVTGLASYSGDYDAEIVAVVNGTETRLEIPLAVSDPPRRTLKAVNDFSTSATRRVSMRLGVGAVGASYEGSGAPAGIEMDTATPSLGGTPEEIGTFVVQIKEFVDGELADEIEFTWTVLPSTRPAFPL